MAALNRWTPEKLAQLRQLWEDGVSGTKIGLKLGFTKNAIVGKAHRLGLPRRAPSFAAELATKPITEEQRETVRSMWLSHSVPQIKAVMRIGWRRIIAIAADLGLPSRADLVIERNKKSARLRDRPSGARPSTTPRRPRAARPRAVPPAARGSRASFPPPALNSPAVAPLPALQQRRVFSSKCRFPLWSDKERPTHFYCDEAVTMGCYCEAHAVLCYIGTNSSLGEPNKLRWRA